MMVMVVQRKALQIDLSHVVRFSRTVYPCSANHTVSRKESNFLAGVQALRCWRNRIHVKSVSISGAAYRSVIYSPNIPLVLLFGPLIVMVGLQQL